jgi:chemotaxis signal transduction protein
MDVAPRYAEVPVEIVECDASWPARSEHERLLLERILAPWLIGAIEHIDLRLKLDCETAEYTDFTVVIVLNLRGRVMGVVVDSVSDVLALGADNIKPASQMNTSIDAGYIMGIGCVRSGDVERTLILTVIEAQMGSGELGLLDAAQH